MPILLQCPQCKARMKAPDGSEGRKAKCPRCGTLIPILASGGNPEGGEEAVEGGEDAGMFTETKKTSSPRMPAPKASKKSDFDFVDDDEDEAPPIKKGRKIVEEDEEEERPVKKGRKIVEDDDDERPVKKGRKVVEEDDDEDDRPVKKGRKVVAEDDDDDDAAGFRDEPDDDDDDDRPRKKKKKKRRRSSSGADIDPNLIQSGWSMAGGAIGLAIFAWCCCPILFIPISSLLGIAALFIGITVAVKGDAANGIVQAGLGLASLAINAVDIYAVLVWMPTNDFNNF